MISISPRGHTNKIKYLACYLLSACVNGKFALTRCRRVDEIPQALKARLVVPIEDREVPVAGDEHDPLEVPPFVYLAGYKTTSEVMCPESTDIGCFAGFSEFVRPLVSTKREGAVTVWGLLLDCCVDGMTHRDTTTRGFRFAEGHRPAGQVHVCPRNVQHFANARPQLPQAQEHVSVAWRKQFPEHIVLFSTRHPVSLIGLLAQPNDGHGRKNLVIFHEHEHRPEARELSVDGRGLRILPEPILLPMALVCVGNDIRCGNIAQGPLAKERLEPRHHHCVFGVAPFLFFEVEPLRGPVMKVAARWRIEKRFNVFFPMGMSRS